MPLLIALRCVGLIWGTIWLGVALLRLRNGDRGSILFVYMAFFAMFILPLGCDLAFGQPNFYKQPGYWDASRDSVTMIAYCLFCIGLPPYWIGRKGAPVTASSNSQSRGFWLSILLILGLFSPFFLIPFSPQPSLYLEYAFIVRQETNIAVTVFHTVISAVTVIAVLCASMLIAISRRVKVVSALCLFCSLAAVWINGKRAIFALAVLLFLLAYWYRGALGGRKLFTAIAFAALLVGTYTIAYQSYAREINSNSTSDDEMYENSRVDYGRESRLQMVLYSEFHPSKMQILDYPGQSFLFLATFWVPRERWEGKPYPYAVYFTCAMLGRNVDPMGWAMTTSILDEAVANLGWLGLFIGPWLVKFVCRTGDGCRDPKVSLLTAVVGSLMLAVQIAAFLPLALIWLLMVISKHVRIELSIRAPFEATAK